jgi:hypothetical protein
MVEQRHLVALLPREWAPHPERREKADAIYQVRILRVGLQGLQHVEVPSVADRFRDQEAEDRSVLREITDLINVFHQQLLDGDASDWLVDGGLGSHGSAVGHGVGRPLQTEKWRCRVQDSRLDFSQTLLQVLLQVEVGILADVLGLVYPIVAWIGVIPSVGYSFIMGFI